jgi:MFS family permease
MGLLVGLITASVTLGSAAPYLFSALGGVDWHRTSLTVGCSSFVAALLISRVEQGPLRGLNQRFVASEAFSAWKVRSLRLANLGYFGHKWENYAMWAGIGGFLQASLSARHSTSVEEASYVANLAAFAVVAFGSIGCLAGGILADRIGRTRVAIGALAISGTCCLCAGFLFNAGFAYLLTLCLLWGFAIVADSGQFSSCVIELSDSSLTGTLLTVQTCIGFVITLPAIQLVAFMAQHFGWQHAFSVLAIGPVLGIIAMARLRADPDAIRKLGHGKG